MCARAHVGVCVCERESECERERQTDRQRKRQREKREGGKEGVSKGWQTVVEGKTGGTEREERCVGECKCVCAFACVSAREYRRSGEGTESLEFRV